MRISKPLRIMQLRMTNILKFISFHIKQRVSPVQQSATTHFQLGKGHSPAVSCYAA